MGKGNVLIVGGTGRVGKSFGVASLKAGHPTFMLVRDPTPSDPAKAALLESLQKDGLTLVKGDLIDREGLLEVLKKVKPEIVVSIVGWEQFGEHQFNLIDAMKKAGTVKRFFPSEYAIANPERALPISHSSMLNVKLQVREASEKAGIPSTYFLTGAGNSFFLRTLWDPTRQVPPRDFITIYGDGNTKSLLIDEDDMAKFTFLAAEDPRTENKILYCRPEGCYKTQNEIVAIWEEKIGKKLEKKHVSKEDLVKKINEELPFPQNFLTAFIYSYMVAGYKPRSEYEANEVEATELYPDEKFTSCSEYLDRYV